MIISTIVLFRGFGKDLCYCPEFIALTSQMKQVVCIWYWFSKISGDGEHSIPEGDGVKRDDSLRDSTKSNSSHTSHRKPLDWREVRATFCYQEKV